MFYRQAYFTDDLESRTALQLNPIVVDKGVVVQ